MMWRRGEAYSQDLRSRVLATADEGIPVGRIATTFRVSVSYVSKVLSRRRASGEVAARPRPVPSAAQAVGPARGDPR
jgi:transposase